MLARYPQTADPYGDVYALNGRAEQIEMELAAAKAKIAELKRQLRNAKRERHARATVSA